MEETYEWDERKSISEEAGCRCATKNSHCVKSPIFVIRRFIFYNKILILSLNYVRNPKSQRSWEFDTFVVISTRVIAKCQKSRFWSDQIIYKMVSNFRLNNLIALVINCSCTSTSQKIESLQFFNCHWSNCDILPLLLQRKLDLRSKAATEK